MNKLASITLNSFRIKIFRDQIPYFSHTSADSWAITVIVEE